MVVFIVEHRVGFESEISDYMIFDGREISLCLSLAGSQEVTDVVFLSSFYLYPSYCTFCFVAFSVDLHCCGCYC